MAGLNHQACGELDPRIGCALPSGALVSEHSNQDEKGDLDQERGAHNRDCEKHVARRYGVHHSLAFREAPMLIHLGGNCFGSRWQNA